MRRDCDHRGPGWDGFETGKLVKTSISDHIWAAFDCCDATLKSARVTEGLAATHKMACFFIDIHHDPIVMDMEEEISNKKANLDVYWG